MTTAIKMTISKCVEQETEYFWILGQYHTCWCPGGKSRQDISRYDIDYKGSECIGGAECRGT